MSSSLPARPHVPLVRCRVQLLGRAAPAELPDGIDALQKPLAELFIAATIEDAVLTVYTSGLLLQPVHAASDRWWPIQDLRECAALRPLGNPPCQFIPLSDTSATGAAVFACILCRHDIAVSDCWAFITKSDQAAMALLGAARLAHTHRAGWATQGDRPAPKNVNRQNVTVNGNCDWDGAVVKEEMKLGKNLPADYYQKPPLSGFYYTPSTDLIQQYSLGTQDCQPQTCCQVVSIVPAPAQPAPPQPAPSQPAPVQPAATECQFIALEPPSELADFQCFYVPASSDPNPPSSCFQILPPPATQPTTTQSCYYPAQLVPPASSSVVPAATFVQADPRDPDFYLVDVEYVSDPQQLQQQYFIQPAAPSPEYPGGQQEYGGVTYILPERVAQVRAARPSTQQPAPPSAASAQQSGRPSATVFNQNWSSSAAGQTSVPIQSCSASAAAGDRMCGGPSCQNPSWAAYTAAQQPLCTPFPRRPAAAGGCAVPAACGSSGGWRATAQQDDTSSDSDSDSCRNKRKSKKKNKKKKEKAAAAAVASPVAASQAVLVTAAPPPSAGRLEQDFERYLPPAQQPLQARDGEFERYLPAAQQPLSTQGGEFERYLPPAQQPLQARGGRPLYESHISAGSDQQLESGQVWMDEGPYERRLPTSLAAAQVAAAVGGANFGGGLQDGYPAGQRIQQQAVDAKMLNDNFIMRPQASAAGYRPLR